MVTQPEPQLPSSSAAEFGTLLGAFCYPEAIHGLAAIISPCDFYDERYGIIFETMIDMDGVQPNVLTLTDALEASGKLEQAGGVNYIFKLSADATKYWTTPQAAERHARSMADYATRRRLIEASSTIAKAAWEQDAPTALARAHAALTGLSRDNDTGLMPVSASISGLYDQVEEWGNNPLAWGEVRGLATGIPGLDNLVGGMNPGELTLLAARPAIGKTALALEIARRVGVAGGRVAIFELEMTRRNILMRWASCISEVETRKIKRGIWDGQNQAAKAFYVTPEEMGRYVAALGEMEKLSTVSIDDSPGLTSSDIRMRSVQYANRLGGMDLIVVDHTGIIKSDQQRGENTAKSEGRKSREMHELAKELGCPVLLVQQLNRGVGNRTDKRPSLDDLRDSGEHEENADVALGLYRDSYYNRGLVEGSPKDMELEVLGLKNREGPTKKATLRYERHIHRFSEFGKG